MNGPGPHHKMTKGQLGFLDNCALHDHRDPRDDESRPVSDPVPESLVTPVLPIIKSEPDSSASTSTNDNTNDGTTLVDGRSAGSAVAAAANATPDESDPTTSRNETSAERTWNRPQGVKRERMDETQTDSSR